MLLFILKQNTYNGLDWQKQKCMLLKFGKAGTYNEKSHFIINCMIFILNRQNKTTQTAIQQVFYTTHSC